MGLRHCGFGSLQGHSLWLPANIRAQPRPGNDITLTFVGKFFWKLPFFLFHNTSDMSAWSILEDIFMAGGPDRVRTALMFSTLAPNGKYVAVTPEEEEMQDIILKIYKYRGSMTTCWNPWIMRARGKEFRQQPNSAFETHGDAWGRDMVCMFYFDKDAKKYILVFKNPLFPHLRFDGSNLDEPCKFEDYKALAGVYDIDFEADEETQRVRHRALRGRLPFKPGVFIPPAKATCIQCHKEQMYGTQCCRLCSTPMSATDQTVQDTLKAEGIHRVAMSVRTIEDRKGRGQLTQEKRLSKRDPNSHEHRRRTRGRAYQMIDPNTGAKYKCPWSDGAKMSVRDPTSTFHSIHQVYQANDIFKGIFNQRYESILGRGNSASDEFLHAFDRALIEARDGAISIPAEERQRRFNFESIHQTGASTQGRQSLTQLISSDNVDWSSPEAKAIATARIAERNQSSTNNFGTKSVTRASPASTPSRVAKPRGSMDPPSAPPARFSDRHQPSSSSSSQTWTPTSISSRAVPSTDGIRARDIREDPRFVPRHPSDRPSTRQSSSSQAIAPPPQRPTTPWSNYTPSQDYSRPTSQPYHGRDYHGRYSDQGSWDRRDRGDRDYNRGDRDRDRRGDRRDRRW